MTVFFIIAIALIQESSIISKVAANQEINRLINIFFVPNDSALEKNSVVDGDAPMAEPLGGKAPPKI